MGSSGRSRNWLFTINHITSNTEDHLRALAKKKGVRYIVWGHESAPTTGHAHLQGFIIFENTKKFSAARGNFSPLHPRLDRGDAKAYEMMMYCKKDGRFEEHGQAPIPAVESGSRGGKKTAETFYKCIRYAEQGKFAKIRREAPGYYARYYRTWLDIHKDKGVRPDDLENVTGVWIYGPSGAGKSHYAREHFGSYYDKCVNKWFDGYQKEDCVLIDDFDKNHDKLAHHLKRWADRYSFTGEIKGGMMSLRPKFIVVTSQYRIEDIWADTETREALNRRFRRIKIHINSQGERVITEFGRES